MNPKLLKCLAQLIVAFAVGSVLFGALCFIGFDQQRKRSVLEDAYTKVKAQQNPGEAEDRFFKGPIDPALSRAYQPLDANNAALLAEYETAKKGSTKDLDAFFEKHILPSAWVVYVALSGLFVLFLADMCEFGLLYRLFRGTFEKYTRKMIFVQFLMGGLGGYFAFMAANNIYPMGIDLAGGTELIYRLDYETTDLRLDEARRRRQVLQRLLDQNQVDEQGKTVKKEDVQKMDLMIEGLEQAKATASEKAVEVIRRRVDPTGAKGIPITKYGEDRIRIQLPKAGPEEVERIKKAVQTGGKLTFHICLDDTKDQSLIEKINKLTTPRKELGGYELKHIEKVNPYNVKDIKRTPVYVKTLWDLEGSRVVFAGTGRGEGGGWEVRLRFDSQGSAEFEELTANNVGKQMAIVLDNKVESAPVIRERIGGECRISGNFSETEAKDLADILTTGSLPADVRQDSVYVVGPALGSEQIRSGVIATVVGSVAVALFMWIYYRVAGFIAVLCLFVLMGVMMGALGFFKATMTMPGIAGILLNLGMAVDANVLIYERIREEFARGRNMRQAVQFGFDRALVTILDAQLTTLISAIIMYYLGSGPVRGFAVTLSIGILVSLFANLWVCRLFFDWLVVREAVEKLYMMQIFKPTHFDFMGSRRIWYTITGAVALLSLAGALLAGNRMLSEDFTGGSLVQFNFAPGSEQSTEKVREVVDGDLKTGLKGRLEEDVKILNELAASGLRGAALKVEVLKRLPEIGHQRFGPLEGVQPEQLLSLATLIEKELKDLERTSFTVQAAEKPVAGPGEARFRSFTVTARLADPTAIFEMHNVLLKLFLGKIEQRPVELVGAKHDAIRVRFDPQKSDIPAETLVADVQGVVRNKLATDKANESFRDPLLALQVSPVKTEGEVSRYVDLSPLPADPDVKDKVLGALETAPIPARAEGPISRESSFGPQVAGEMATTAILAVLASLVGIWLYLWFRFEFSGAWGFGAIVADIHDATIAIGGSVLVTVLGFFYVSIDLNMVAAVLTIIGYSVNDTIVIYDRIREVKAQHPTRNLADIVNEAVNATLSRTIITSLTVWITLVAMLLFGGETIRGLAWTLLVGVIVGTYSSIFIASPLMIWWYKRFGASFAAAPGMARAEEAAPSGAQI